MRAVHQNWFDATARKDLDRLMAHIADDIVSYEHEAPLQYHGVDAVREVCGRGLDWTGGAVGWDVPDMTVLIRDDLAVVWGLNRMQANCRMARATKAGRGYPRVPETRRPLGNGPPARLLPLRPRDRCRCHRPPPVSHAVDGGEWRWTVQARRHAELAAPLTTDDRPNRIAAGVTAPDSNGTNEFRCGGRCDDASGIAPAAHARGSCMIVRSSHRPNLVQTSGTVPTWWNPDRSCRRIEEVFSASTSANMTW